VCEPTLVVKSGRGAPTTMTTAEAVAEKRSSNEDENVNGTVRPQCKEKKQI